MAQRYPNDDATRGIADEEKIRDVGMDEEFEEADDRDDMDEEDEDESDQEGTL